MYKTFFGLRENPFNINPDPRFLYLTSQTRDSLQKLTSAIDNRQGFTLLTGEVGTGKTTLINYVRDWLHQRKMPTAFIFNSHLGVTHLFEFILADFCVPVDYAFKTNMLLRLNNWLIERVRAGQTPVLIVDEAQGLSFELLEEIRLLLNLETNSQKLLQIILVGQPELEVKLMRPELRLLRQRIALRCTTQPLTLEESCAYVSGRLRIGGATGNPLFDPGAMEAVHYFSRGIPRVMNLLCEHALINAYVEQSNPVQASMVELAARDFLLDESRAATSRSSLHNSAKSNLTVMQTILSRELEPVAGTEDETFSEPFHAPWSPTSPESSPEEFAPTVQSAAVTTLAQDTELEASAHSLDLFVSLNNLLTTPPASDANHNEKDSRPASIASTSNSATQFITEMKLNLPARVPASPLQLIAPKAAKSSSSSPHPNQISAKQYRLLTLDSVNRLPSHFIPTPNLAQLFSRAVESSRAAAIFLSVTFSSAFTRFSTFTLPNLRERIFSPPVLRRCFFELKRDWNAMIQSIAFPDMKNSLLTWLREPLLSKPKPSSKSQTAQSI